MYSSAPLKAFLADLETLLFDGEVVLWLIPNKSLRISPPLCSPRISLRYPSRHTIPGKIGDGRLV